MIKAIISGIFNLIIGLVSIILSPIDLLIATALPDLSTAFTSFGNLLHLIGNSVGWGVSLLGISQVALNIITMYYIFVLTYPMAIWMMKLAIQWYDKLKP